MSLSYLSNLAEDTQQFAVVSKKIEMEEEKRRLLQEWAADALVDAILNRYSVSRIAGGPLVSLDELKGQLSVDKSSAYVCSFKHAIFKKDCGSEIYQGKFPDKNWVFRDKDDRVRPATVEDVARFSSVYENLHDYRPGHHGGSTDIFAVMKHTDFVDQLASRFGDSFTCSWNMYQSGEETQYWTPYVIQVCVQFWPNGVAKEKMEKIAKAQRDFDYRSQTMIVTKCMVCQKGLTRNSSITFPCVENCHCSEHDTAFCSEKCMKGWA